MSDTQDNIIQEKPLALNPSATAGQVDLIGLSRQELEEAVIGFGLPKFRDFSEKVLFMQNVCDQYFSLKLLNGILLIKAYQLRRKGC